MIVGHDQKLAVRLTDDDTGSGGFSLPCIGLSVEGLYFLCEVIVDRYDGRHDLIDNSGQFRIGRLCVGDDQTRFILDAFGLFKGTGVLRLRCRRLRRLFLCGLRILLCGGILCGGLLFCLRCPLCRRLCRLFFFLFSGDGRILIACGVRDRCLRSARLAYIAVYAPETCADACAEDDGQYNREEALASSASVSVSVSTRTAANR